MNLACKIVALSVSWPEFRLLCGTLHAARCTVHVALCLTTAHKSAAGRAAKANQLLQSPQQRVLRVELRLRVQLQLELELRASSLCRSLHCLSTVLSSSGIYYFSIVVAVSVPTSASASVYVYLHCFTSSVHCIFCSFNSPLSCLPLQLVDIFRLCSLCRPPCCFLLGPLAASV